MSANFDSMFDAISSTNSNAPVDSNPSSFDAMFDEVAKSGKPKQERSFLEKAGRIGGQFALGAAENALLPYEIATIPVGSKAAQETDYLHQVGNDIEDLLTQKAYGKWTDKDEEFLQSLYGQIEDPDSIEPYLKTANIGVRGLAEKVTGLDLHPEGVLEKAAGWAGFIKDPTKLANLAKEGLSLGKVIKAISPTGKDVTRALGAGAALQLAEEGEFGPIGTMAAAVVGDLAGAGVGGLGKAAVRLGKAPKETIAKSVASFTKSEQRALQKEIIEDFRKAGIQADLGTITDNNLIKWTQARIAQSGLTGKALDDFKSGLTNQIKSEYQKLSDTLGHSIFESNHEAGQIAREGMSKIRESDLAATRQFYQNAEKALKDKAYVYSNDIVNSIERLEKNLKPGSIKGPEQQKVLDILDKLRRDVTDSTGSAMMADVKDLMNNKIALNDIINYEVQGGSKQLLKGVVKDLDRAIISHGKENPSFAKNYINANKKFSEHAKTFRNKNVSTMLNAADPVTIVNKMNSVEGIRNVGKVLTKTPEGKEIFDRLKKLKLDKIVGDNLVDSTSKQVKLGTFSKILEKGKNKELVKEILGKDSFKRLERLQKNSGRLAESVDKFYNASKSGAVAADAAVIAKLLGDFGNLIAGNPWPLIKTTSAITGTKQLSQLITDPQFLKLVEDAIIASEKGNTDQMIQVFMRLKPYAMQFANLQDPLDAGQSYQE